MALETASVIYGLNEANPPGTDGRPEGDNHLRLLKTAVKGTFLKGVEADRPAAGTEGRRYIAADTRKYFYDTGAEWIEIAPTATGPIGTSTDADVVLTVGDHGKTIFVDVTAASRSVTLPVLSTLFIGWWVNVVKIIGSNNVLIKDSGGTTIRTLYTIEERAHVVTDKNSWFTYPNIPSLGFHATKGGTTQTPFVNGTWTKLTWSTEVSDNGGVFGSSDFVAPRPGAYLLVLQVAFTDAQALDDSDDGKVALYVDGSPAYHDRFEGARTTQDHYFRIVVAARMTKGQTVNVYYRKTASGSGNEISGDATITFFQGRFLHE